MNRKRDILAAVILVCSLGAHAQDDRYQCDDTCEPGTSESVAYNVVCPVGFSTVEPVEMAPRLATLEGKTIAIVGEDFMQNVTHPEIGRIIKENYPTAFLITGDASRNKVQTMPGGGFSTVSIELPAAWDSLMAAKNYPVLTEMYLTSTPEANNTAVQPLRNNATNAPVRSDYYNMQGQRTKPRQRGAYVRRDVYTNGHTQTEKRMGGR